MQNESHIEIFSVGSIANQVSTKKPPTQAHSTMRENRQLNFGGKFLLLIFVFCLFVLTTVIDSSRLSVLGYSVTGCMAWHL